VDGRSLDRQACPQQWPLGEATRYDVSLSLPAIAQVGMRTEWSFVWCAVEGSKEPFARVWGGVANGPYIHTGASRNLDFCTLPIVKKGRLQC